MHSAPRRPARELVLEQVEKIVRSKGFAKAEKLGRLLSFTVGEALEGRAAELKETVLAVEVFDRPSSFDPRLDPIVRVQAGKLRTRLKEYYEAEGRDDAIIIEYPKGHYVPVIQQRERARRAPSFNLIRRRRKLAAAVALACAALMTGFLVYRTTRGRGDVPSGWPRSVVVLPFVSLSADEPEYFCDGLTEELINSLSRIEGLRVVARTSAFRYKGKNEDIRAIGRELDVDAVLEGSVRREGELVRISAQLADARDGYHLWAGTYEREMKSVFALQEEITQSIVDTLQVRIDSRGEATGRRPPANLEAYRLYLQGRYFWHRRTPDALRKAAGYFHQAIEQDPDYAAAYAGLADAYSLLAAYEIEPLDEYGHKALEAAARAVDLDDRSAEGHAALGYALATFGADWVRAEKAFRRAIALNPGYATAHQWFAMTCLSLFGRLDEALREMQTAVSLDPVSAVIAHDLGRIHTWRHEFPQAIRQYRKAIELEPAFARARAELGFALESTGDHEGARRAFEEAVAISKGQPGHVADLARFYAATGRTAKALELLAEVRDSAGPYHLAAVYAALNRDEEALAHLERGLASKRSPVVLVERWAGLRSHPRYAELWARLRLP